MRLIEIFTALLFYLPFVLTIVFGFFALTIGIFAIFSGTLLVLFFAAYGFYAVLRDTGVLKQMLEKGKTVWTYVSTKVELNLRKTFLLKDTALLPKRNALYICHPHGLFGYSWILHFCYGISEWPHDVPKPLLAIHSIFFHIPFVRDIAEQFHCIEAKEQYIQEALQKGNSVAILTGGIEEMMYNGEKESKLVLKKRNGYARIAKHCSIPIVPLFTQGENELFPTETYWLWTTLRKAIRRWTGLEVPLPSWSSMKQWICILQKPLDKTIETFVLGVIDTQEKDTVQIKQECESCYSSFFEREKIQGTIIT